MGIVCDRNVAMTREQAIQRFGELVPRLSDEQLEAVVEMSAFLAEPRDFDDLSPEQQSSIDAGLRDAREGRLVEASDVHGQIAARIASASGA